MDQTKDNPEYLDYRVRLDDVNDITFDIDEKIVVNSKTSIKIILKAKKEYPSRTLFRFVIPYGWEPINLKNEFFSVESSVKGKIKANKSLLMVDYILHDPMSIGDTIEFNYNKLKKVNTAGDIAYIDEVYFALDVKLPKEKMFTRIGLKRISMISEDASFFLIKVPTIYRGKPVDVEIVALDKFGNRDYHFNGEVEIQGDSCLNFPNKATMSKGYVLIEQALKFKEEIQPNSKISRLLRYNMGFTLYPVSSEIVSNIGKLYVNNRKLNGTSNPIVWDEDFSSQVYWGDTHIHTKEFSDGMGTGDDAFHYAKNVVLHDFAALGDHLNQRSNTFMEGRKEISYPFNKTIWESLIDLCREWTDKKFTAIPAYEWSGRNYYVTNATKTKSPYESISDKVILFPLESAKDAPLIDYSSKEGCFQHQLYDALKDEDCAIISHTPISYVMGTSWTEVNDNLENVVEIYSSHGSSESMKGNYRPLVNNKEKGSVIWALNNGFKLGFIGGGDDHYSHPGCPARQYKMKNLVPILRYKPGIAAIFSDRLDSKNLIQSLNQRKCYATTGERMWLKIKIDSALMGQTIDVHKSPVIIVTVCGTNKLESVELLKNGNVVAIRVPSNDRIKFAFEDTDLKKGDTAYFYARSTQFDGERGWTSPIWVTFN